MTATSAMRVRPVVGILNGGMSCWTAFDRGLQILFNPSVSNVVTGLPISLHDAFDLDAVSFGYYQTLMRAIRVNWVLVRLDSISLAGGADNLKSDTT